MGAAAGWREDIRVCGAARRAAAGRVLRVEGRVAGSPVHRWLRCAAGLSAGDPVRWCGPSQYLSI